jgi:hypothetical protein
MEDGTCNIARIWRKIRRNAKTGWLIHIAVQNSNSQTYLLRAGKA